MVSLTILKPGKQPCPQSGNLVISLFKRLKNTKDLKSSTHWDGRRESSNSRDSMMMPKEVTTSIVVQIPPFRFLRKTFRCLLRTSSRWMLEIFGSVSCLICKFFYYSAKKMSSSCLVLWSRPERYWRNKSMVRLKRKSRIIKSLTSLISSTRD